MFYRIAEIKLPLESGEKELRQEAVKALGTSEENIARFSVYRKSLDMRRGKCGFVYAVDVKVKNASKLRFGKNVHKMQEKEYRIPYFSPCSERPVVVGFGPAGIFAALLLAQAGLNPLIIERGKAIEERVADVNAFASGGALNPESNIQFGEGGAGTFSDGKLNTLLKDKNERGRYVLSEFVGAGAPEEILWWNKPHIGTDRLRIVIPNLRRKIESLGGRVRFEIKFIAPIIKNKRIVGIEVEQKGKREKISCSALFLGIGHSARDTFCALNEAGIPMEKKVFSVGVRIEHLQSQINRAQYKEYCSDPHLSPADYKLNASTSSGKVLYTFCMCPGGEVVCAAGEEGGVVTNGMSNFLRDGENANSALLIQVNPDELPPELFSGMEFQRELERKAFALGGGNYRAPCQKVGDFLADLPSQCAGEVKPSYARGVRFCDLRDLFPAWIIDALKEGICEMDRRLSGFADPDALLTAVESRSSSPVRILRGENFQSEISGLYPIGEGAGYAGGIMSAAMDGMKAAEAYFKTI